MCLPYSSSSASSLRPNPRTRHRTVIGKSVVRAASDPRRAPSRTRASGRYTNSGTPRLRLRRGIGKREGAQCRGQGLVYANRTIGLVLFSAGAIDDMPDPHFIIATFYAYSTRHHPNITVAAAWVDIKIDHVTIPAGIELNAHWLTAAWRILPCPLYRIFSVSVALPLLSAVGRDHRERRSRRG